MRRSAALVGAWLLLNLSCGGRTDPWSIPGLSGANPGGGKAGSIGTGATTGFGSGTTTSVGGAGGTGGAGTGGSGVGGNGTGTGGTGAGGTGSGGDAGSTGGTGTGGSNTGVGGTGGSGTGGTGTGGAGVGGSAGAGTGGTGTGGTGAGGTGPGGTGGTAGGRPDGGLVACFRPLAATLTSVDIHFLVDKSSSMAKVDPPDVAPNTRWSRVTTAIDTFARVGDARVRMGLGFYPKVSGDVAACDVISYVTPEVPIHWARADSLVSRAIAAERPGFDPWARPALEGALSYTVFWSRIPHPVDTPASLVPPSVVLMMSAPPVGCGGTIDQMAVDAAAFYRQPPHVRTHVVAVGAEVAGLESIAVAGGTHRVYDSKSLSYDEILARIARSGVVCDIPFDRVWNNPDLARLEVRTRFVNGDPLKALPRVADMNGCGASGGWYVDPPVDPSMISVCPATCAAIVDSPAGQLVAGEVFTDMPCIDTH